MPAPDVWCGVLWVTWQASVFPATSRSCVSGLQHRNSAPSYPSVPSRASAGRGEREEAGGSVTVPGEPGHAAGKWPRRTTICSSCCWSVTAASGKPACCSGSAKTPSTPPSSPPSVSHLSRSDGAPVRWTAGPRLLASCDGTESDASGRANGCCPGEGSIQRGGGGDGTDVSFSWAPADLWPHWGHHWSVLLICSSVAVTSIHRVNV